MMTSPTILIPGIEATALINANSFGIDYVWNAFDTPINAAANFATGAIMDEKLQIDGISDEKLGSLIERSHLANLPYREFVDNLNATMPDSQVYLFGYDWRLSNMENALRLKAFVIRLAAKLERNNIRTFNFVTHSMGGLIFSCFLKDISNHQYIEKAVLNAPPFKGSPVILSHMIKGESWFRSVINTVLGNNTDMRKGVRTLPSCFELLPYYDKAIVWENDPEKVVDLLDINNWQSNILDDEQQGEKLIHAARLASLKKYRQEGIQDLSLLPEDFRKKLLIVVGKERDSKQNTVKQLHVIQEYKSSKRYVNLDEPILDYGDGTVPVQSSGIYHKSIQTLTVEKSNLFSNLGDALDFHGLFLKNTNVININKRFLYQKNKEENWWESLNDLALIFDEKLLKA